MTDFAARASRAGVRLLRVFGDDATYTDEADHPVRGVLSSAYHRVQGARGPAISSKRVEFRMLKSSLDFEPCKGGRLTVRDVLYEVADVRPDAIGVYVTLVLKRV